MFTVRLHRPGGIQVVYSGTQYAIGADFVELIRPSAKPNDPPEQLNFIVTGHAEQEGNPHFAKIEVFNAANVLIDTVREVPSKTKELIAEAVRNAKANGDLPTDGTVRPLRPRNTPKKK